MHKQNANEGLFRLNSPREAIALLVCAAVSIAAAGGCGSSVYGQKFEHRLELLRISSEFSVLRKPTIDLAINFRVPKLFKQEFTKVSADPENNNHRISPSKFGPPFLIGFPGLERMFEGEYEAKNATSPVFLYIGEGNPAETKGKFPYKEWSERITRGRFQPSAWEAVDVQTPSGEKLKWQRLTAKGKFVYNVAVNHVVQYPSVDTFFQMWVYETPQAVAVLGWWSTEEARLPSDIEKLAMLTAGTAVVSQNPPAPPVAPPTGKPAAAPVKPK